MALQTTGLTAAVREWFVNNPGPHRPTHAATALGAETAAERMSVNNLCARLTRKGELIRGHDDDAGGVTYQAGDAARERVDADSRCSCCGQKLPAAATS